MMMSMELFVINASPELPLVRCLMKSVRCPTQTVCVCRWHVHTNEAPKCLFIARTHPSMKADFNSDDGRNDGGFLTINRQFGLEKIFSLGFCGVRQAFPLPNLKSDLAWSTSPSRTIKSSYMRN